jgi:hypothetical protein
VNLSGRDISDICKDAERKWASKYIRKEVSTITPDVSVYIESTQQRLEQMQDINLRMEMNQILDIRGAGYPQRPTTFN